MKRTGVMLFLIFLELALSLAMLFVAVPTLCYWLLSINILLFIVLALEPYWKIGGWLTFIMQTEVNIFVLNFVVIEFWVPAFKILNLLTILSGLLVVLLAHKMRLEEEKQEDEDENDGWAHEEQSGQEKKPEEPKEEPEVKLEETAEESAEEKKNIEVKSYFLYENKLHLSGCPELDNVPEEDISIIGSRRYAESNGYLPCEKCRPFE
ncbi:hypothetical protein JXC34_00535 [Candidatus Woesearchaeota archaeon]|nr:hypothetical protein [Candidatus Woesearchaeota archaeon]